MSIKMPLEEQLRRDLLPLLSSGPRRWAAATYLRAQKLLTRPRWGNLLRPEPFSSQYGFERGTPIDRRYLSDFVRTNAHYVHGRVLEIESSMWSRYAHDCKLDCHDLDQAVTVVDVDPLNTQATLIADLCSRDPFGGLIFDCELVFQTLQYLKDPAVALGHLWRALAPGGTLLVSAPVISRLDDMLGEDGDLWHFTPAGLRHLLSTALPGSQVKCEGFGSLATASGFLYGMSAGEIPSAYWRNDRRFPVIACAVAKKAPVP